MKGTIVKCIEEMVRASHGEEKWKAILVASGQNPTRVYMTTEDVPDADVMTMLGATAKTLGISMEKAMDAFGEHWSTKYAPDVYRVYFDKCKSTRELLLSLDGVHVAITRSMKNAAPPRFEYDASDPKKLVMKYSSARGMVALMPGLIRGVAKYYRERVKVTLSDNTLTIEFAS